VTVSRSSISSWTRWKRLSDHSRSDTSNLKQPPGASGARLGECALRFGLLAGSAAIRSKLPTITQWRSRPLDGVQLLNSPTHDVLLELAIGADWRLLIY